MKITWYGHSCFRFDIGGSVLLIDPFLKGNPKFEASGIAWDEATKGVTHVALTHGHDDHIGDSGEICKTRGATLFAPYELAMHVATKGAEKLEPMNHGGTIAAADFSITYTDALHSSSSGGVYLGNPCGIVVTPKSGKPVYHMGDTDVFPGMDLINKLYAPKAGIVPIGDRFTMGGAVAALACQRFFGFRKVIPCHYGTFPMLDQTADKFVTEMSGQNVVVPAVGGSVEV
ncbi:MAG: metal-dependent hydrolase [Hyphomicrobiaceae bacterium]|nr:metal-dependent hydrolase [Hyphomicrobiaceae bacterium]